MIWSKFEEVSQKVHIMLLKDISEIISDSSYNEIFDKGITNISFYNSEMKFLGSLQKYIQHERNKKINLDSNFLSSYFLKLIIHFLLFQFKKINRIF